MTSSAAERRRETPAYPSDFTEPQFVWRQPDPAAAPIEAHSLARAGSGLDGRRRAAGRSTYQAFKRLFDFSAAFVGLVILLAPMALVWCLVRLTSKGPGLFWSKRVGRGGRTFWMPKFRSMRVGTALVQREKLQDADSAVTLLGHLLRKSSIDELPQLWCILVGEMSFIGPRPLIPNDDAQMARLRLQLDQDIRPGITGLAQINGRNAVGPRAKARYDVFYAQKMCALLDANIFVQTIGRVIRGAGIQ